MPRSRILRVAALALPAAVLTPSLPPAAHAQEPAAEAHAALVGTWQGQLAVQPGMELAMVVHLSEEDGRLTATLDSPDQGARGIPVREASFEDGVLVLDVAAVAGRYEGTLTPEGRIAGTWSQGGAAFPLEFERVEEYRARARPQDPEPPFPYRAEDIRYSNPEAGIELAGTLTLPEGEGPFPAVALVTGSGAQNRDSELMGHRPFLVLADHLTRRGIAVLRSDDRGVGESEGVFAEATSRDFAGDAAAAADYLRSRPEVDAEAVGLVGLSEGGMIAPIVSAEYGNVAFVVLLAGTGLTGEEILYLQGELIARAMGVPEEMVAGNRALQERLFRVIREEEDHGVRQERLEAVLRRQLADLTDEERAAIGVPEGTEDDWVEGQLRMTAGPWFRYFLIHDPAPVLQRVRVPVLAINGELDLQVPPAENLGAIERALAEGGNPDYTVVELPGLNHLFQTATTGAPAEYGSIEETMSPAAMELVAEWILERFGPGGRTAATRPGG